METLEQDYQCPATNDGHRYIVVGDGNSYGFRLACERCAHVIRRALSS